jgi:hypothetical protein
MPPYQPPSVPWSLSCLAVCAMFLTSSPALDVFLLASFVYLLKYFLARRARTPYPPGPKGLPLIGNLLDLPKQYEWETFTRWGQEFGTHILHSHALLARHGLYAWDSYFDLGTFSGDLVMVNALGTRILVINSPKAAIDLFGMRSSLFPSASR